MHHKNNLPYLLCFTVLLIFVAACNSSPETDEAEISKITVIATEVWTETPPPTELPSATSTVTLTPTSLPSATPTLVPTSTPVPTETPVSPEFTNLVLALDYDQDSLEALSPQDYFPAGVTYIATVFDYMVPGLTKLDWHIYGANEKIEASGIATLNPEKSREAFIIRPEMGLDEGDYELSLELDGEVVLSRTFEVYWNPTLWPVTIGAHAYSNGEVAGIGNRFPFGTEFLFASYPTINFTVGDELVAEWFVEGEKLGEHQFVWDSPDWSTGIHANKIDNQVDSGSPLPVGSYELFVYVNGTPKQCKAFEITQSTETSSGNTAVPVEVQGCEAFEAERSAPQSQGSWDRYQTRTFSELESLTEELLTFTEEKVVYLEYSPDYQYPSRVQTIFTGDFRDTSEFKLEWITMWMGTFAPNLTEEEVAVIFGQEGLFMEGTNEYWIPVQSSLIPIMKDELSSGDETELLVVWIGATVISGEVDRIYLVNAFE